MESAWIKRSRRIGQNLAELVADLGTRNAARLSSVGLRHLQQRLDLFLDALGHCASRYATRRVCGKR
jgi:hypothetical protein